MSTVALHRVYFSWLAYFKCMNEKIFLTSQLLLLFSNPMPIDDIMSIEVIGKIPIEGGRKSGRSRSLSHLASICAESPLLLHRSGWRPAFAHPCTSASMRRANSCIFPNITHIFSPDFYLPQIIELIFL